MSYKVSVCVPIYNVSAYIEKCARSLFEQTCCEMEYIFVDDCSPDNSVEVLRRVMLDYPNRIPCIQILMHEQNRGLAAARNTAVGHASGEYIMHVDSDDYIEKETVERIYGRAACEEADIIVFDMKIVGEKTQICRNTVPDSKLEYIRMLLLRTSSASLWGKMFRRSLYLETGIKEKEGLNMGEDYATTPRLVYCANKIIKINEAFYNYAQINGNAYTKTISRKHIDDLIEANRLLSDYFEKTELIKFYPELLEKSKLCNKIVMLKACACNRGTRECLKYVVSLYPKIKIKQNDLPRYHRFLLMLADKKSYRALEFFIRSGYLMKRIKKQC